MGKAADRPQEPVVVTEPEYHKARSLFAQHAERIRWVAAPPGEEALARAAGREGARIAVLGAERYRDRLYESLQANAGEGPGLIARFGVGYDGVDLEACRRRNLMVTITSGALNRSVAEHTVALVLGLARGVPALDRSLRSGRFSSEQGIELQGTSLGIAGFGSIGKEVSRIASAGLGMRVHAYDVMPLAEQCSREGCDPEELLGRYGLEGYHTDFAPFAEAARIVCIHMAATEENRNFFDSRRIAQLKAGGWLVNTSRGSLVDEEALYHALVSGHLRGAALDVFSREPYEPARPDADLRRLDNVVLTPHVASNTGAANRRMGQAVVECILAFVEGRYDRMTRVA